MSGNLYYTREVISTSKFTMYTCSIFNEMQKYSTTLDILHKCIVCIIRNIPKFH